MKNEVINILLANDKKYQAYAQIIREFFAVRQTEWGHDFFSYNKSEDGVRLIEPEEEGGALHYIYTIDNIEFHMFRGEAQRGIMDNIKDALVMSLRAIPQDVREGVNDRANVIMDNYKTLVVSTQKRYTGIEKKLEGVARDGIKVNNRYEKLKVEKQEMIDVLMKQIRTQNQKLSKKKDNKEDKDLTEV